MPNMAKNHKISNNFNNQDLPLQIKAYFVVNSSRGCQVIFKYPSADYAVRPTNEPKQQHANTSQPAITPNQEIYTRSQGQPDALFFGYVPKEFDSNPSRRLSSLPFDDDDDDDYLAKILSPPKRACLGKMFNLNVGNLSFIGKPCLIPSSKEQSEQQQQQSTAAPIGDDGGDLARSNESSAESNLNSQKTGSDVEDMLNDLRNRFWTEECNDIGPISAEHSPSSPQITDNHSQLGFKDSVISIDSPSGTLNSSPRLPTLAYAYNEDSASCSDNLSDTDDENRAPDSSTSDHPQISISMFNLVFRVHSDKNFVVSDIYRDVLEPLVDLITLAHRTSEAGNGFGFIGKECEKILALNREDSTINMLDRHNANQVDNYHQNDFDFPQQTHHDQFSLGLSVDGKTLNRQNSVIYSLCKSVVDAINNNPIQGNFNTVFDAGYGMGFQLPFSLRWNWRHWPDNRIFNEADQFSSQQACNLLQYESSLRHETTHANEIMIHPFHTLIIVRPPKKLLLLKHSRRRQSTPASPENVRAGDFYSSRHYNGDTHKSKTTYDPRSIITGSTSSQSQVGKVGGKGSRWSYSSSRYSRFDGDQNDWNNNDEFYPELDGGYHANEDWIIDKYWNLGSLRSELDQYERSRPNPDEEKFQKYLASSNDGVLGLLRKFILNVSYRYPLEYTRRKMGVDWDLVVKLSQHLIAHGLAVLAYPLTKDTVLSIHPGAKLEQLFKFASLVRQEYPTIDLSMVLSRISSRPTRLEEALNLRSDESRKVFFKLMANMIRLKLLAYYNSYLVLKMPKLSSVMDGVCSSPLQSSSPTASLPPNLMNSPSFQPSGAQLIEGYESLIPAKLYPQTLGQLFELASGLYVGDEYVGNNQHGSKFGGQHTEDLNGPTNRTPNEQKKAQNSLANLFPILWRLAPYISADIDGAKFCLDEICWLEGLERQELESQILLLKRFLIRVQIIE